jgi:transposase
MAKLTDEQVVQIKNLLARGYRQCDIAKDFGVSRSTINDMANGHTWAHINAR